MKNIIVLCILVCFSIGAKAQQSATAVHPTPSDLASALQVVSVVINRMDKPLTNLSSEFDTELISTGMHDRRMQLSQLATKWASVITVSNGKEVLSASDLFTIYTELLNIQLDCADLTREERFVGKSSSIVSNATTVIRASAELLPVVETLKYATADRIDLQEAACSKPSKNARH